MLVFRFKFFQIRNFVILIKFSDGNTVKLRGFLIINTCKIPLYNRFMLNAHDLFNIPLDDFSTNLETIE